MHTITKGSTKAAKPESPSSVHAKINEIIAAPRRI
jgi:hypothetical protein